MSLRLRFELAVAAVVLLAGFPRLFAAQPIRVGSKPFNEGYILAEIVAQLLEDRGFAVERKFGLGGTLVCYQALVNGEIDVYPEYSGTLEQAILKLPERQSYGQLQAVLRRQTPLELLAPFGFNNTYALTVRAALAKREGLHRISDLRKHPELRFGLSYEYLERGDGWGALARYYGLSARPVGMEHSLSYQALEQGKIDVMDVYTTDAEIRRYDLTLLEDDKGFFPTYLAAPLVRRDLDPGARRVLEELAGEIDEAEMQRLNAEVVLEGKTFAEVAEGFLADRGLRQTEARRAAEGRWDVLARRTLTHLELTAIALLSAMALAIPFGIAVYRLPKISRPVIYIAGLLQTVPSLALLALMIPLFGIGTKPALVALFLYALLPILRNTHTALVSLDPVLKKVSVGMGLTVWQRLRYIELPLSSPHILAGIRTAAVIMIGTATIAAFIGAGGLGEYIVTGLSLNDPYLIMWGAIPAALLAILVEFAFEALERWLIPRHLLQDRR
ncbi:MAG: ABC transporter permease subunit [Calditrichaeota bacterium]|nr:MAG: ABC transporter permease subunit [Calditrichota bacterium]